MKKSGEDRLKRAINESTLSTAGAVPLPPWGRLTIRGSHQLIRPSGIATIYTSRRLDPSTQFSHFR